MLIALPRDSPSSGPPWPTGGSSWAPRSSILLVGAELSEFDWQVLSEGGWSALHDKIKKDDLWG